MNMLQHYRHRRGLSQIQLAAEIGVCQSVISRIETEGLRLSQGQYAVLLWCNERGIDLVSLMGDEKRADNAKRTQRNRIAA